MKVSIFDEILSILPILAHIEQLKLFFEVDGGRIHAISK